jgi:hypothetical protein
LEIDRGRKGNFRERINASHFDAIGVDGIGFIAVDIVMGIFRENQRNWGKSEDGVDFLRFDL